ncbi:MAG: TonB-dependent receptor [Lentisphaerales bacterium]|nr:TonB-dependent receptor [Lentisphaerales bacterium]
MNRNWRFTASARIYWGFPGAEDYSDYHNEEGDAARFGYEDNDAFSGSYFVNTGLHYQVSENLTLRLNAYNILGRIDIDYNKRSYIKRFADYQPEAASVGLELSYKFKNFISFLGLLHRTCR